MRWCGAAIICTLHDPQSQVLFSLLQMITHSKVIAGVLLVDMLALLMYNVSGMCVTGAELRIASALALALALQASEMLMLCQMLFLAPEAHRCHDLLAVLHLGYVPTAQQLDPSPLQATWGRCSAQFWKRRARCSCGWCAAAPSRYPSSEMHVVCLPTHLQLSCGCTPR